MYEACWRNQQKQHTFNEQKEDIRKKNEYEYNIKLTKLMETIS